MVLLTGDGAGINSGEGFLADAIRLATRGWKFEVYSWDAACHTQLKEFAEKNGKYVLQTPWHFERETFSHLPL